LKGQAKPNEAEYHTGVAGVTHQAIRARHDDAMVRLDLHFKGEETPQRAVSPDRQRQA